MSPLLAVTPARRPGRSWALLAALCLLGVVVAGCTSSSSSVSRSSARSVNAQVGNLRLLHVRVDGTPDQHSAGSDAALFLTIANDGSATDTLTAVSATDAGKVVLRDGDGPATTSISVPVDSHDTTSLQQADGPHLELVGLTRDVSRRTFLPVRFTFAGAGSVTVDVWVQALHPSQTGSTGSP